MNVVSTAQVLPRTPADVGGFISVVFVGPGKFKLEQLGTTFQVRKSKLIFTPRMESFLACVIMSSRTMSWMQRSFLRKKLLDDTADGLESVPFLEKMGVSDPESVNPDLIVHRGAHPISEYNNPDLFPALSFQLQARHSLTLSDRSFRYHQFYVFVVWNLLQRRLAHIHTSLSCRKSNFQHVAHKITQLSPEILMRKGHWIYSSTSMLYQPVYQAQRLQRYLPEMRFAVTMVFLASHTSFSPSTQVSHIVHFSKSCMVITL